MELGLEKKIHTCLNAKVWENSWMLKVPTRIAQAHVPVIHLMMSVRNLIMENFSNWNEELFSEIVEAKDVLLIESLTIGWTIIVGNTPKRIYTRQIWKLGCNEYSKSGVSKKNYITEHYISTKKSVILYIWQQISGYIVVTRNLNYRDIRCDNNCIQCGIENETYNHVIFEYPPDYSNLGLSPYSFSSRDSPTPTLYTNFKYHLWR